ncbi:hypothetical protein ACIHCV_37835 [Streptomyces sp. NPDC051956]|uniref:hypothetical protein n=1 Tax=Streptomyces sp. NPDC051956 TaxID=3365677 RepID=UPI0037D90193
MSGKLCERLPTLDQIRDGSEDMGNAIEILVDTERRPDEIGRLPWDCLETDEHGKSVLIYTDFKNNCTGCRLPIPDSTAEIIVRQKKSIRARWVRISLGRARPGPSSVMTGGMSCLRSAKSSGRSGSRRGGADPCRGSRAGNGR